LVAGQRSARDHLGYRGRLDLWAKDRLIEKGKGPTPGGTQTGILRFQMENFVHKWSP